MTGHSGHGGGLAQAEVVELDSVPGFIVFDLPGAQVSAGGTRLAPDVTVAEVALLARAMTYKFAVLGAQVGGAKAGVVGDPADRAARAAQMARFCEQIRPLTEPGRFLTGPDMGTFEEDFAPLRAQSPAPSAISATVGGVPFEDVLTGYGDTVAAETALSGGPGGGWAGRAAAIEGFGKVGGGVASEVTRRGGKVIAVSTIAGCVTDPAGLDIGRLLELRQAHGDRCVSEYGLPVTPPGTLFTVAADVMIPGTRPGMISEPVARALPDSVLVLAPAANVPYTSEGAQVLRRRGILALPDFICNAGAVIGYRADLQATPEQVLTLAGDTIAGLIGVALTHPAGPLAGGCEQAVSYLRGWRDDPPGPPFAPAA
jgi:glutamate dehydrogenase (NAD(P)+)